MKIRKTKECRDYNKQIQAKREIKCKINRFQFQATQFSFIRTSFGKKCKDYYVWV